MRGRWASAALGAGMARRRASQEMDQQAQAYEAQQHFSECSETRQITKDNCFTDYRLLTVRLIDIEKAYNLVLVLC